MVGTVLVWIAFVAALVSSYSYYRASTGKKSAVRVARQSFSLMAAGLLAASVLLMIYIVRHQFEYSYVWSYSSRDLPLELLITTFWAGQEGSFLFWALCSAVIGVFVLRYTQKNRIEYETMAVYSLLQAFLVVLLIAKSPFVSIWDAFPGQIPEGQLPADGRGLNPLLQNFWMIIHPPVLFIGFAAAAVPFSLALAALWRKTFSEWIPQAYPWVLFTVVALGAGLMLGGYWAYGVLGWGGWWGWDPVENSSLVPWIISAALLHTMVVQKKTGKLARTNFILAIVGFLLVIYSTFLTRSGILGESSVHSFVDPGKLAYTLLVLWMVTVTGLGFGVLFRRWTALKSLAQPVGMFTRESFLSIAATAMAASAAVILFGTSWPLFSASTVEPSFYDSMNLPIAVILSLLLGISLLLQWRMESLHDLALRTLFAVILAAVGTVILFFLGLTDPQMVVLGFASLFALVINVRHAYRVMRDSPRLLGGALAHIGLALLFLAIIGSGRYGQKMTATLQLNESKTVFGYTLTYRGSQAIENGKHEFVIRVENDGSAFSLKPVMYYSEYSKSVMRNPDYATLFDRDFYIEPVSLEQDTSVSTQDQSVLLVKGEPTKIGEALVTFLRFDMNQHSTEDMTAGAGFTVGAVLEIQLAGKKEQIVAVSSFKPNEPALSKPVHIRSGALGFQFLNMNVDMERKKSSVLLGITGLAKKSTQPQEQRERLVIEASVKPVMSFVWLGAAMVLGGVLLAMFQTSGRLKTIPSQRRANNGKASMPESRQVSKHVPLEEQVES